jgi:hypothetical protein
LIRKRKQFDQGIIGLTARDAQIVQTAATCGAAQYFRNARYPSLAQKSGILTQFLKIVALPHMLHEGGPANR